MLPAEPFVWSDIHACLTNELSNSIYGLSMISSKNSMIRISSSFLYSTPNPPDAFALSISAVKLLLLKSI